MKAQTRNTVLTWIAILGGVLTLIGISDRVAGWIRPTLVITAERSPFVSPPGVSRLANPDHVVTMLEDVERVADSGGVRIPEMTANHLAWRVRDSLQGIGTFPRYETLWRIRVENRGSERLSSVTIMVPDGLLAVYQRPGSERVESMIQGVVQLGEMLPDESFDLVVWGRAVSAFQDDELRVVHAKGKGTVHLRKAVGKVGQFVDSTIGLPFLLSISLLAMFSASALQLILSASRLLEARAAREAVIDDESTDDE